MRKIVMLALVGVMVSMVGCSTSGPVIGPFSYLAYKSNQESMATRAVMKSELSQEKKTQYVRGMALGSGDGQEMAVGVGLDVLAIYREKPKASEVAVQSLGAVLDGVLEYYVGKYIYDQVKESSDGSNDEPITTTINGNYNNVTVSTGDSNTSNSNVENEEVHN